MTMRVSEQIMDDSTLADQNLVQTAELQLDELTPKSAIATLSALAISKMSRAEMIRCIETVECSLPQSLLEEELESASDETLERLVYLARRCCRNQGY